RAATISLQRLSIFLDSRTRTESNSQHRTLTQIVIPGRAPHRGARGRGPRYRHRSVSIPGPPSPRCRSAGDDSSIRKQEMTTETPRVRLPFIAAAQAQKHVTHNEALAELDALIGACFLDRDLTTAPSSPSDGDAYLVKVAATGEWAGQEGKIAFCLDGDWRFYAPFAGLVALVADENRFIAFDGTSWNDYAVYIPLDNVAQLGVNTSADSTNKFAVKSNAVLFAALEAASGGTGDIRLTVNKEASTDTASLLFQDGFSGRAEIGLAGDDDFHFKVSPDGSAWTEAVTIDKTSGLVTLAGDLTSNLPAATKQYVDANAGGGGGGGGAPTNA